MLLPRTLGGSADGTRGLRVGGVVLGGGVAAGALILFDSVFFFETLKILPQGLDLFELPPWRQPRGN